MLKNSRNCALFLLVISTSLFAGNARKDSELIIRKGKKGIIKADTVIPMKITRGKSANATIAETVLNAREQKKLSGLHPQAKVKMKAALVDMEKAGVCPLITSAYRSTAEQRDIYHCSHRHICKVRRGIFSARKPGTSLHEAGLAVDFADVAYGKKRRRHLTREGKQIVNIMERHGFKWRYGLKDPAHFELEPRVAGYRSEKNAIAAAQYREAKLRLQSKKTKEPLVSLNRRHR